MLSMICHKTVCYGYTLFYTDELFGLIADKMKNHPYYTQQFSQQVWFRVKVMPVVKVRFSMSS
mgnify:CR=1 FL=1